MVGFGILPLKNRLDRRLIAHTKDWPGSSYAFYAGLDTKIRIDPVD